MHCIAAAAIYRQQAKEVLTKAAHLLVELGLQARLPVLRVEEAFVVRVVRCAAQPAAVCKRETDALACGRHEPFCKRPFRQQSKQARNNVLVKGPAN